MLPTQTRAELTDSFEVQSEGAVRAAKGSGREEVRRGELVGVGRRVRERER